MRHFLHNDLPDPNNQFAHILVECGCCGACHPYTFRGDCRENDSRFLDEVDYSKKTGIPLEKIEVQYLDI